MTSVRGALLGEYFGRAAFGRLIGILFGIASIGGIVGPTLAGFLFDTTGSYSFVWIGLGVSSFFTILLIMSIEKR